MTASPTPLALRVAALLTLALLGTTATIPASASAAPHPAGRWPLRPVPEVVAGFAPPPEPWAAGHRGVDLLGSPGQLVRAALPGRVSFAGMVAGRGVVVVDHGPTRTTYEPVMAAVDVGQRVAGGDPLGSLEVPGSHCFPRACLHWGWIRGATYLDPLGLVGAGPVRLLPLWRDLPVGLSPAGPGTTVRPSAAWHAMSPVAPPRAVSWVARAQARGCACW